MRVTWLQKVSLLSGIALCWACAAGRPPLSSPVGTAETVAAVPATSSRTPEEVSSLSTEQILRVFFPYRQGPPQSPGVGPGTALSRGNWQIAENILPPEILNAVRDGEFTILVQDTTDLPVSPDYITATIEHAQQVSLNEAGGLEHYQAGLPFPVLDPADPTAGLKAAWNARYADRGDSIQRWESLHVQSNTGEYQHGFSFFYAQAYGMHRVNPEYNIPDWAARGILYKEFIQVFHPVPSLTIHPQLGLVHLRYWYDDDARQVGQWYMTGYLARNRLVTLAYNPEASAWRFPVLYEDLSGTYVSAYQWRLLETKVALVPGFVQGAQSLFGGRLAGYPLDPWELRTVYVVEAVPRRARHPYGRKVFVFDQQTFAPLYVLIYDRQGAHWRTGFFVYANPAFYPGTADVRVPILVGRAWLDVALEHVTLALVEEAIYNAPIPPDFFTQANLIRKGK